MNKFEALPVEQATGRVGTEAALVRVQCDAVSRLHAMQLLLEVTAENRKRVV